MMRSWLPVRLFLMCALLLKVWVMPASAQTGMAPGALIAYATIHSIGVEWDITGDTNHDARAAVDYRLDAGGAWQPASPLIRVDYNGRNMLAGSVLFLTPGSAYRLRLTLSDPDGGSATRELVVSTRAIPRPPSGGRTFHVVPGHGGGAGTAASPFLGIAAAQTVAQPGDTFLLHGGHYGGRAGFTHPGAEGAYVTWRAAGDGEVVFAGIDIYASHLWFEGITVRDQYYGTRTAGAPVDVVITRSAFFNNVYGIFLNGGGTGWYIADNVIVGATPVDSGSFEGEGIELALTSGHTVAHNRISGAADGISYPHTNVDIFGNDIFDTADDGVELDGGHANVRMWANRIHNAVNNGISFQPQESGPWYIVRNQIVGSIEAPLKFRTTDRFVLVHNTIATYAGNMICCSQSHLLRGFVRNNLWISAQGGQMWNLDAPADWRTDFDYDGVDWGNALYPLVYGTTIYYDLPSFSRATGLQTHGVRIYKDQCLADFRLTAPPPAPVPPHIMSLTPHCNAVNAGAILPNLNDGFAGWAPDLGAHELGGPPAHYGPRDGESSPGTPGEPAPETPLPGAWTALDIGATALAGSTGVSGETWTLTASGSDVWGTTDAFRLASQRLTGDGVITARVTSISNTHAWTKAGVMMRGALDAGAAHAFLFVTPGTNGLAFQRRPLAGGGSVHAGGGAAAVPVWLRLVRTGSVVTAFRSDDGTAWTQVGQDSIAFGDSIDVGLAVTSHDNSRLATATFDNLTLTAIDAPPPAPGLPAPWSSHSIGTAASGSARAANGVWSVEGDGADVWGTADAFHFAWQPLAGDGSITARVVSVAAGDVWGKAGVMVRGSLDASASHAFLFATPGGANGLAFQRRVWPAGATSHTSGGAGTAAVWLRLTRSGSTITAARSFDGEAWTVVGTDTLTLGETAYVGLAVTSHAPGRPLSATFDSVTLGGASSPAWRNQDIGAVVIAGHSSVSGSTASLTASGADIWGAADAFQFAYQAVTGNVEITARVVGMDAVHAWTKAGVMIRASTLPGSAHASLFATPSAVKGVAFQRRPVDDGLSVHAEGPLVPPPVWLRLTRAGDLITAAYRLSASDGWTPLGSESAAWPQTILIGLAVTSHQRDALATAYFDSVSVTALP